MQVEEFLRRCAAAGEVEINMPGGFFFSYLTGFIEAGDFDKMMKKAELAAAAHDYKPLSDFQMMQNFGGENNEVFAMQNRTDR